MENISTSVKNKEANTNNIESQIIQKTTAIKQICNLIKKYGQVKKDPGFHAFKWGEEIQGHLFECDQQGVLQLAKGAIKEYKNLPFPVYAELSSWSFETVPPEPYQTTCNFYDVINPMRNKYKILRGHKYIFLTIPYIPIIGISNDIKSYEPGPNNQLQKSPYVEDDLIADFDHFVLVSKYMADRYGDDPILKGYFQLYKDSKTNLEEQSITEPKPGFIQLDSVIQAWSSCNLQTTFSANSLEHARYMNDQLHNLIPFCLALTAGTPFLKGKIQNKDTVWEAASIFADDRTPSERDSNSPDFVPIIRNTPVPFYINNGPSFRPQYNDIATGVRPEHIEFVKQIFKQKGVDVDDQFIYLMAYLSMRDVTISKVGKEEDKNLIEMMILYTWPSVRFRTPVDDQNLWRLEFRPMEILLTADQNSAFCLLTYLMARLLVDDPSTNFLIPISKTMENYERAQAIDAAFKQRFFFRTNIHENSPPVIEELTAYEILFGKGDFCGLFAEFQRVMSGCIKNCPHTAEVMGCLKNFISGRATGKLKTLARWQRDFVDSHPGYTHNSILSLQVINDMLLQLHRIESGQVKDEHFANIFPDAEVPLGNGPNHPNKKCSL